MILVGKETRKPLYQLLSKEKSVFALMLLARAGAIFFIDIAILSKFKYFWDT